MIARLLNFPLYYSDGVVDSAFLWIDLIIRYPGQYQFYVRDVGKFDGCYNYYSDPEVGVVCGDSGLE